MLEKTIERREKVLSFVEDFYITNKYPPTVRQICAELNIKSTSSVFTDLRALSEEGRVTRANHAMFIPAFTEEFTTRFINSMRPEEEWLNKLP